MPVKATVVYSVPSVANQDRTNIAKVCFGPSAENVATELRKSLRKPPDRFCHGPGGVQRGEKPYLVAQNWKKLTKILTGC